MDSQAPQDLPPALRRLLADLASLTPPVAGWTRGAGIRGRHCDDDEVLIAATFHLIALHDTSASIQRGLTADPWEQPITSLCDAVEAYGLFHAERVADVCRLFAEPRTIDGISSRVDWTELTAPIQQFVLALTRILRATTVGVHRALVIGAVIEVFRQAATRLRELAVLTRTWRAHHFLTWPWQQDVCPAGMRGSSRVHLLELALREIAQHEDADLYEAIVAIQQQWCAGVELLHTAPGKDASTIDTKRRPIVRLLELDDTTASTA